MGTSILVIVLSLHKRLSIARAAFETRLLVLYPVHLLSPTVRTIVFIYHAVDTMLSSCKVRSARRATVTLGTGHEASADWAEPLLVG